MEKSKLADIGSAAVQACQPKCLGEDSSATGRQACQICGGRLIEIRAKLQCERCRTIWETCCEGGRG